MDIFSCLPKMRAVSSFHSDGFGKLRYFNMISVDAIKLLHVVIGKCPFTFGVQFNKPEMRVLWYRDVSQSRDVELRN